MIKFKRWCSEENNFSKIVSLDSELIRFSNLSDKDNIEIWGGDIRELDGKIYKLEDEGWRFTFWRYNERVILTEDTGYTSKYIGNIYENKELLNLFK